MRPRSLPRILIGKQALVQLLDKKVGLGVASLTSARKRIVLEVAGQHVCLPRVHNVRHLGKDFEESGPSASTEGVVLPLQKPRHFRWRVLAEDCAIDEANRNRCLMNTSVQRWNCCADVMQIKTNQRHRCTHKFRDGTVSLM